MDIALISIESIEDFLWIECANFVPKDSEYGKIINEFDKIINTSPNLELIQNVLKLCQLYIDF